MRKIIYIKLVEIVNVHFGMMNFRMKSWNILKVHMFLQGQRQPELGEK